MISGQTELQNKVVFQHPTIDVPTMITGVFGADMQTELITDGPVTIVMSSAVLGGGKK